MILKLLEFTIYDYIGRFFNTFFSVYMDLAGKIIIKLKGNLKSTISKQSGKNL